MIPRYVNDPIEFLQLGMTLALLKRLVSTRGNGVEEEEDF